MADLSYAYREDRSCSGFFEFTQTQVQYADTGIKNVKQYAPFDQGDWLTISAGASNSTGYAKAVVVKTDGDVAAGALADVTGLSVTFTTTQSNTYADVRVYSAYGVAAAANFTVVVDVDAGAQSYSFEIMNQNNGSGGDTTLSWPGNVGIVVTIASAGSHTIKIRQSGSNSTLRANATSPATLVVDYLP